MKPLGFVALHSDSRRNVMSLQPCSRALVVLEGQRARKPLGFAALCSSLYRKSTAWHSVPWSVGRAEQGKDRWLPDTSLL